MSAADRRGVVAAQSRGVNVPGDFGQVPADAQYSSATFLSNVGVPTFIDTKHAIAHSKVMIIDGDTVITGSFNFSKAAEESNAENLLFPGRDRTASEPRRNNAGRWVASSPARGGSGPNGAKIRTI
jgi:phosphatidylserine/phosphatidylglycerophosphate/cardiolipin synthase-like enzyme